MEALLRASCGDTVVRSHGASGLLLVIRPYTDFALCRDFVYASDILGSPDPLNVFPDWIK